MTDSAIQRTVAHPTPFCPWDSAGKNTGVVIPFSGGSSQPRDQTWISCIAGRLFTVWAMGKSPMKMVRAQSLQLCPTLCYAMDCSPPTSFVLVILQARILEWVAVLSSRGVSQPRNWTSVSCIAGRVFTTDPLGKPYKDCICVICFFWNESRNPHD